MPYIGRDTDKISNVEVLDNITFDGSSSYTLQKGGSNFTPSSANTLLLSIDGVVQAGNFTVSGSTIDFGTAVAGTSTCDFVLHYGVGLITAPSDGTVTTAKLADSSVSLAKLTATGTKDATTFLRGDNTFASPSSDFVKISETDLSSGNSSLILDWSSVSSIYDNYEIRISYQGTSSNALGLRGIFGGSPSNSTIYTIGTRYWVINTSNGTGGANVGDYNTYNQAYIGYSASATASVPQAFNIRIFNPNDTTGHKILQLFNSYRVDNTPVEYRTEVGTLFIRNNTALDGLQFIFNGTGGANSGKISLWGLK